MNTPTTHKTESAATSPTVVPDSAHGSWWNLARLDYYLILLLLVVIFSTISSTMELDRYVFEDGPPSTAQIALTITGLMLLMTVGALLLPTLYRLCVRRQSSIALSGVMATLAFVVTCLLGLGGALGILLRLLVTVAAYKIVRCVSCTCLLPPWMLPADKES